MGDFVTFPNDRGLQVGRVQYLDANGEVVILENAVMLNEQRLGAKLVELEDADDE